MVKNVHVAHEIIPGSDRNRILLELFSDFSYSFVCDCSQDKKSSNNYNLNWLADSFFDLTGYKADDLNLSELWMFVVHPEDYHIAEKQLKITKPGSKDVTEFRIIDSDGKIIWIKNYIYCVEAEEEGFLCIYGVAQDITESKKSEKETKDMVEFLQTLTDTMPSSIFYKDTNGIYLGCNKEYADFVGLSKDEIIGKSVYDIFSKDLADKYHNMDSELLENPGKQVYDWKMNHSDGTIHDVMFNKATYSNTEGDLAGLVGVMVDITDLKQIERALKESEEKYRLLAENSSDVIWTMSLGGHFTFVTPAVEELSGYTPEEALQLHLSDYILEDYYPIVMHEIFEQLNKPAHERVRSKYMELKEYKKDGSIIDIEVDTRWIYDDKGNPVGLQGSTRDITERKMVEEALKRSEYLYRTIFENTGAATVLFNKEGTITRVNSELKRISGYLKSEVENKMNWRDVIHPDELPKVIQYHKQREKDPNSVPSTYETKLINNQKNGEPIFAQITVGKIPDSEEYIASIINITDLKNAQKSLQESEEKFRQMAENIEELMYIIDPKMSKILYISPSYEKIWGRSREELYKEPKSWIGAIHPDDRKKAINHIFTADQEVISHDDPGIEYRIIHPEGSVHWIWGRAFPVLDDKGKPYRIAGIALDITDRKLAEEEVKSSLKEKELLLREIHHRVKNNLQIIVSLLSLQAQHVDDKEVRGILTESQNRVKSMAMIHEKLYESPDLTHINFKYYIEKLVTDLFYSHNVEIGTIEPVIITMDLDMGIDTAIPCGLIINELVTNSIKYAFPDGCKGTVTVEFGKTEDEFSLKIADNGIGMSKDIKPDSPRTFGLQLVENLVNQLDGTITCDINHGTVFTVKFKELIYKDRI